MEVAGVVSTYEPHEEVSGQNPFYFELLLFGEAGMDFELFFAKGVNSAHYGSFLRLKILKFACDGEQNLKVGNMKWFYLGALSEGFIATL